jgi:hypothetical protein
MSKESLHGPFLIPAEQIASAGFDCTICRQPVKVARQSIPHLVPRLCMFACDCDIAVAVWEDERQPTKRNWKSVIELGRKAGVGLVMFNGSKPTPPEFSGQN